MMAIRVFIIHGYLSHPEEAWLPWLKRELEQRGCSVSLPAMPHPDHPVISEWIDFIAALIGEPDNETLIVGHSLGCQAVLRYLESVSAGKSVRKAILVAGTFPIQRTAEEALKTAGGDRVLLPWFSTGVDASKVKAAAGECTVILSDNDPYIDLPVAIATFRAALNPTLITVPGGGHFNEDDHWMELPEALAAITAAGGGREAKGDRRSQIRR
jgi:predicted alpha/beta hydrolase family esterase